MTPELALLLVAAQPDALRAQRAAIDARMVTLGSAYQTEAVSLSEFN